MLTQYSSFVFSFSHVTVLLAMTLCTLYAYHFHYHLPTHLSMTMIEYKGNYLCIVSFDLILTRSINLALLPCTWPQLMMFWFRFVVDIYLALEFYLASSRNSNDEWDKKNQIKEIFKNRLNGKKFRKLSLNLWRHYDINMAANIKNIS